MKIMTAGRPVFCRGACGADSHKPFLVSMVAPKLALAFAAVMSLTTVSGLDGWWMYPDGVAWGTLCVEESGLCRSYVHTVAAVKPSTSPLAVLFGAAEMSYDGGTTWSPGPLAAFETHLVMDNQAQVFTFNWDWLTNTNEAAAIAYPKSDPTALPSSVCMRAWLTEVGSGDSASLEATCFNLSTSWVSTEAQAANDHSQAATKKTELVPMDRHAYTSSSTPVAVANTRGKSFCDAALTASLLFGNWTVACSASLSICRTMGHVAVDVTSPLVVAPLSGGGHFCEGHGDGCDSYKPSGELTWLSYFDGVEEQSATSQRWHWSFDQSRPYDPAAPLVIPSEMCYSIWFVDPLGTNGRTRFVNMRVDEDSISHWSGYALSETVRCWPVNETSVLYVA
mmetsp:Transcript_18462/g.33436  ORF Transcript_18462/g.33436 Transcript_18462/m.33436 type:complete len:394 (+) Transcript_18462:52-1233(+)